MAFLRTAGIAPIVSITLILFIVGLMGIFFIRVYQFRSVIRQDVGLHVFIKDEATPNEIEILRQRIANKPAVLKQEWISKEDALATFIAEGNEDPTEILSYNPLPASVHVFVRDSFAVRRHLSSFKKELEESSVVVSEVRYAQDFVEQVNINIQRITLVMLSILGLLVFISIILIDNTIRLGMLHNRFSIKTMQYAGARNWFIAFPYIKKGFRQGVWSGLLSVLMVLAVSKYFEFVSQQFSSPSNQNLELFLYLGLFFAGTLIAVLSTRYSVYKYLRTSSERLYS